MAAEPSGPVRARAHTVATVLAVAVWGVSTAGCDAASSAGAGADAMELDGGHVDVPEPAPGGGLWVVDAEGVPVGALVRRGGDDSRTGRALYDLVTVYAPASGLFFDITMADGQVRYPATTYFRDSRCQEPVGVAAGACATCVAGYGVGLLHAGTWWRVVGGAPVGQVAMGSTRAPGISETCVAHGTSSAKGYPIEPAPPPTPPTAFTPPLRFSWRHAR